MKVTVRLNTSEIIKAIQFYLETNGVPDGRNGSFPIEFYYSGTKLGENSDLLTAQVNFDAEHFTMGPYR